MPKKRYSAEQIVMLLRQIEVATSQGKSIGGGVPGSGNLGSKLFPLAQGVWRS